MLDYSKEKESMGEQVDPFDLTKKQEADLQRIRQFRLIDDVFMNKVFENCASHSRYFSLQIKSQY